MKVLMVGRGVIATVYGWALARAGHDVEFVVRRGRAAAYGDTVELDLLDARRRPWGRRVVETLPVRLRETLDPGDDVDLVLLSVPHHRLAEATAFLAPRVGRATVLILGNVWAEPADALGDLPPDQVVWGFPLAGGGFGADGVLHGALFGSVVLGTSGGTPGDRERAVRQLFRDAGIRPREEPDLRGWWWVHFASDAGLFSRALQRGSVSDLVGATGDLREALLTGRELLRLVEARGADPRRHRSSLVLRAPTWVTAPVLARLTTHVAIARVAFAAHDDPDAEEPRAVCRDALAEARRLGVPVPRLEAAEPFFTGRVGRAREAGREGWRQGESNP